VAKQWPEYMGTYKGLVLETGVSETKNGFPQFVVKVLLTAYYDQKEGEWFDVSDNEYALNGYMNLIGRKGGAEDGESVRTLNFSQIMTVFGWDGAGLTYLRTTDFKGKEIQVRIAENTSENAKTPCQIAWIDAADADPSNTLRSLDEDKVKTLEDRFADLWETKKVAPATAKKLPAVEKKTPPATETEEPETPKTEAERKAEILAKGKRLLDKGKKTEPKSKSAKPAAPDKGKKAPPESPTEKISDDDIPPEYSKKDAWNDVLELKASECSDEQLTSVWRAAVAEIAEDGDEDRLDNAGWFAVKEQVLAEIGKI
jgi:hypothetical protein